MQRPFPAYEGSEPFIFVCYAHDDAPDVYEEITHLKDAGFNVWYDEGISPGAEWSADIAEHIERCALFLYFVSPRSVDREYCRKELNFAVEEQKPILHVHLEATEVPPALRLNLSHRQGILRFEHARPVYEVKLDEALRTVLGAPENTGSPIAPAPVRSKRPRAPWVYAASVVAILVLTALLLWNRITPPAPFDRSVAIEPTSTIGTGEALENFAAAMTEDLVARLSRYQELRTNRSGATSDPDLPASYVLQTSVQSQRSGARIRARLVRATDSQTVWSEDFEEPTLADTSADLATAIARFVRLQLLYDHDCELVKRMSTSAAAAAYVCEASAEIAKFSQGVGQGDFELVRLNAEKALALDPDLAEAYFLRGVVYAMSGDRAAAKANAEVALARWPTHTRLLFHQGYHLDYKHNLNYDAAVSTLTRGLEVDPLDSYAPNLHAALGEIEMHRGNLDAAMQHFRRSITVFDASARTLTMYAGILNATGRHEEAIETADAGLALVSEGFYRSNLLLAKASAYADLGDTVPGNEALDEALKLSPQLRMGSTVILAKLGRTDEVRKILQRLESMPDPSPFLMVRAHLALGNNDIALEWMLKGIEERRELYPLSTARGFAVYAPLRSHPRWPEVLSALAEAESAEP